jgi:hypothetical protein
MPSSTQLPRVLLALRLSVFLPMLMWTIDKLIRPEHAAGVFEHFYGLAGLGRTAFLILGTAELLLLGAFVLGAWRRVTYGLVLVLHAISTVSSYRQYLHPFDGPNLLFFAAWPMLAGVWGLYLLRDEDTLGTITGRRG